MNFELELNNVLTIALSSKDGLQESLSASKHGRDNVARKPTLTTRNVLYGGSDPVKTLSIHKNANLASVAYLWYSLSKVYFRDIYSSIEIDNNSVLLHLKRSMLHLYVMTLSDVALRLDSLCKNPIVLEVLDHEEYPVVRVATIPHDLMLTTIRVSAIDSSSDEWEIIDNMGEIHTVFEGDKYTAIYPYCDVALSTNIDIVVRCLGRVKTMAIYREHIAGDHVDMYLGKMLTSPHSRVGDYSNMCKGDTVKRITIRDQGSSVLEASTNGTSDTLVTPESRLMVGLNVEL
jgi:hypothetical protein